MLDTAQDRRQASKRPGVFGIWPANQPRHGRHRSVRRRRTAPERLAVLHHLRQQAPKPDDTAPNYCLADFVAPARDARLHRRVSPSLPGSASTMSRSAFPDDDYSSILIKALADRLAEAFAEFLHRHVRHTAWGYAADESLDNDELIKEHYIGIRPAPGYPACPEHSEKTTLFQLLAPPGKPGLSSQRALR